MLNGKTILDLTWVLGGPFAGQLLAQLGADVIKIESITGDMARTVPPVSETRDSPFFLSVNRGKRSVAIDLKTPEGKEAFDELVRVADAVIYGFAPDVPARLGLDFDSLRAVNPRIVVAQLIGLDDRGDYAKAPAFDLMLQAMSGLMSITGEEDGRPVRVGYQVADLAGGLYLALATVSGLVKAMSTGSGEHVQISLFDAQIAMLTWQAQGYLSGGAVPKAAGARHAMIAPSDAFIAADGRWVVLAPTGEVFWRKMCEAIGRADLPGDPRFITAEARIANVDALTEELARAIATRTSGEWMAIFQATRVPAATVQNVDEALAHPVVASRKMLEAVCSADGSRHESMLGNPFKYEGAKALSYPPALGADTAAVLKASAGLDDQKITLLRDKGVIKVGPSSSGGAT